MKIGPFVITRTRRTKSGLKIYPWQALTEDRVTPELRQVIAKVARSEAKSHLQWLTEHIEEDARAREFIRCELERAEHGSFAVDEQTMTMLYRVLDRIRQANERHAAIYGKGPAT